MTFKIGGENYPFEYKINRIKFNELCEPSFRCTMAIIDNALRDAKLSQDQIDDIVNQNVFSSWIKMRYFSCSSVVRQEFLESKI